MILITGASGMLGSYVRSEFDGEKILTLGRASENDIVCDLSRETPVLGDITPKTVIHCAGTEEETNADALNFEGTRRLCEALELNPPRAFVFVSSYKVYGEDAGENVAEDHPLFADTEAGKSKARAEAFLREWAEERDVTLTIVRPARMFGNGVHGESLQLFRDATSGSYVHVRGVNARVSVVTALDVARGIRRLYGHGGVYNAADGRNPELIELVEALTANAGGKKRMTHLPAAWAAWTWRLLRFVPAIDRNLNPGIVESRMKTLTLQGSRFAEKSGISYFDTIDVIERTAEDYPYMD